ncbi:unnamed protein product, partial [Oppiella nova]
KSRVMGRSPHESATIIINELKLPLTVDELLDQIHEEFTIALKDVQLMPGAERLVRHLYASGIPMAIATGSNSHQYFSKIAKFDHFFSKSNFFRHYVLAGDDPHVKRGKPFPDVFIEAMNRFEPNLKPQNVLVFEDSPLGIEAALAADMPCVWVPDPRTDTSGHNATIVLKSLEDFKPELFGLPPFES